MNNSKRTEPRYFEVWGVTGFGLWEYQCAERTREDAERIARIIRDGYAVIVVREAAG